MYWFIRFYTIIIYIMIFIDIGSLNARFVCGDSSFRSSLCFLFQLFLRSIVHVSMISFIYCVWYGIFPPTLYFISYFSKDFHIIIYVLLILFFLYLVPKFYFLFCAFAHPYSIFFQFKCFSKLSVAPCFKCFYSSYFCYIWPGFK